MSNDSSISSKLEISIKYWINELWCDDNRRRKSVLSDLNSLIDELRTLEYIEDKNLLEQERIMILCFQLGSFHGRMKMAFLSKEMTRNAVNLAKIRQEDFDI